MHRGGSPLIARRNFNVAAVRSAHTLMMMIPATLSRGIHPIRFMHHRAKRIDWPADVIDSYAYVLLLFPFATDDQQTHGDGLAVDGDPRLVTHQRDDLSQFHAIRHTHQALFRFKLSYATAPYASP